MSKAKLNALSVTSFFYKKIKENPKFANFIIGDKREKLIEDLKNLIKIIEDKKNPNYFHDLVEGCKLIWKELFVCAITYIDENDSGIKDFINYFDKFVEFEELLYSIDDFYRDHTTHTLWTYFLGEQLIIQLEELGYLKSPIIPLKNGVKYYNSFKKYLKGKDVESLYKKFFDNDEERLYDTEKIKKILMKKTEEITNRFELPDDIVKETLKKDEDLKDFDLDLIISKINVIRHMLRLNDLEPSVRCIAFLCHDLGYPLKRIKKISEKISSILREFRAEETEEYKFIFGGGLKDFLNEIINYIAGDYVIKENDKIILEKDQELFMNFNLDSESLEHGLMSAFILAQKIHSILSDSVDFSAKEVDVNKVDIGSSLSKLRILKAIALHTCSRKKIEDLQQLEDFLLFIDFIEEFSRMTRATMLRTKIPQFCESSLEIEKTNELDENFIINFKIIYEFDPKSKRIKDLKPKKTFKDKARFMRQHFKLSKSNLNLKLIVIDPRNGVIRKYIYDVNSDEISVENYNEEKKKKLEEKIKKNNPDTIFEVSREKYYNNKKNEV